MISFYAGERIECDDEPGRVLQSGRQIALIELDDGRTMLVGIDALNYPTKAPESDVEDGVHEWSRP